jgi:hypothetical protein
MGKGVVQLYGNPNRRGKLGGIDNIKTGQAMQYDVTLRRVRATIVTVENQYVLHILSVGF